MNPSNPAAPPSDDEPIAALVFDDVPTAQEQPHRATAAASGAVLLAKSGGESQPSPPALRLAPSSGDAQGAVHSISPVGAPADPRQGPPAPKDLTRQTLLPAQGIVLAPEQPPVRQLTTAPPIPRETFKSAYAGKTLAQSIAPALLQPFRGSGPAWLGVLAGGTLVSGISMVLGAVMIFGKAFFGFIMAATVVLYARFFGACLTAAAHEYDDPGNLPDMSQFKYEIGLPLLAIGLWWVVALLPLLAWLLSGGALGSPVATALLLLAILMWPVAMTISSVRRRPLLSMFEYECYPRVILAAPRAWGTVFGVLAGVYIGVWFLGWLVHATLSTILGGAITLLIIPYLHGVAGTLVGRLLVDNPGVSEAAGADI